jgi:uncharacterized membrane protein
VPVSESAISDKLRRIESGEMTRLEAFSDAVFAFAITLLVVSLEVPHTFTELAATMRGFVPFGISFTFLVWIWFQHARFFRRFRMDDAGAVAINGVLLFVIVFYVYPMKFLWNMLFTFWTGGPREVPDASGVMQPILVRGQMTQLMVIYALGFTAIFLAFAALYFLAWARRRKLALDKLQTFDAISGIWENVSVASVGVLSLLVALIGGPGWAGMAGMSFGLIGVVKGVHGYVFGSRRSKLEEKLRV